MLLTFLSFLSTLLPESFSSVVRGDGPRLSRRNLFSERAFSSAKARSDLRTGKPKSSLSMLRKRGERLSTSRLLCRVPQPHRLLLSSRGTFVWAQERYLPTISAAKDCRDSQKWYLPTIGSDTARYARETTPNIDKDKISTLTCVTHVSSS